ncbi:MAG: hypothetical protein OEQ25_12295 [Gammaproteobacteria bacterium]|nr:hypothetical protein [Gammaproteobacteria bacterium]MDH3507908.1 hypothetical protein [Gammaproteobacteria bacterium]
MAIDISDPSAPGPPSSFDANRFIPPRTECLAAFIGRAHRGPLNEPVVIASFDAYRRIFGGHGQLGFLSTAVQQYFEHGGAVAAVVRVANNATRARVDLPAQGQLLRLHAREPGNRFVLRASVDYDGIKSNEEQFNLVVQRLARPGSQLVEDQELFRALSMDESDERFVVDALRSSELVQLGGPLPDCRPDATRAEHPGQPLPYIEMSSSGSDGEELTDYDVVGSNDERTGLFALDDLDRIDLVNIPLPASGHDLGLTTFLAAERYCARRRAILLWDPPWSWDSAATALLGVRGGGLASASAMTYFPRVVHTVSPERHPQGVPAGGAVAGMLAANDRAEHWQVLDGANASLKSGLVPSLTVTDRESGLLRGSGINVFVNGRGHRTRLEGNVSLGASSAVSHIWQRLDRCRLLGHILKSLEQHTRWALSAKWNRDFEQQVVGDVRAFLGALFAGGALCGDRPEQAFFIKLQAAILGEQRELVLRIGIALDKPNEFQIYDVIHRAGQSTTRPAPPREAAQLAS